MLGKLKSRIISPTEVVGVEVILLPDNQFNVTLCVLTQRKGIIHIEKKVAEIGKVEDLKEHLAVNLPVALVINGRSILHKRIEPQHYAVQAVDKLKASIPNLNPGDFYLQDFVFPGGSFLSLLRRELLDKLLDEFDALGCKIVSLTVGPFVFKHLVTFIGIASEQEVHLGNHQLTIKEGEIVQYKPFNEKGWDNLYKIGEETLEDKWLFAYAAALNELVLYKPGPSMAVERIVESKNEWEQAKLFRVGGWGVLLVFLSVLLFNFFLFSHLNQQNIALMSQIDSGDKSSGQIEKLNNEVKDHEHFLKNAGWLKPVQNSFYADRLISTVPKDITLMELAINPRDDRKSKAEKKPIFIPGIITVKGRCKDPQSLNEWLKEIHQLDWVLGTKEQNYTYDNTKRFGYFDFQIVFTKQQK